jgi:small subunit ribosomal protein S3
MGQKVHPRSLRTHILGWVSTWMAKNPREYAQNVKEDDGIRKFVKNKLKSSVSRIEIDRKAQKLIVRIVTGRSGVIIGRGKDVQIDVLEVARIDAESQLIAESIATQLEKRVAYRRALKQAMQRTMRSGVKGIKIMVSGRLGGAEIARTEWAKEGRIPLHTFRADIDYGFAEAKTMFGIIGVKVWVFKGEVMPGEMAPPNIKTQRPPGEPEGGGPSGRRGPGGDRGERGERSGGDNRGGRGRSGQPSRSGNPGGTRRGQPSAVGGARAPQSRPEESSPATPTTSSTVASSEE